MKFGPKNLLAGYLPEELPPPFTTIGLSRRFREIDQAISLIPADFFNSRNHPHSACTKYSGPKKGFSRRNFAIPNPLYFIRLVKSVLMYKKSILKLLKSSKYSVFLNDKLRADWDEFRKHRFMLAQEHIYELKTDISRYFPTIYTHIIPWAIYGRKKAKSLVGRQYENRWGNVLDKRVRSLQEGQSMGIPVGSHISRIIAELIGCAIDKRLEKEFSQQGFKVKAFRYIDDYFFYFSEESTGEKIRRILQDVLDEFSLELNQEKTEMTKFPFGLEPNWVIVLRSFKFRNTATEQENDIKDYFSAALNQVKSLAGEPLSILRYALRKLHNIKIKKRNWSYFESWLLKILLYDPGTLPEILRLLLANKKQVNNDKVKIALEKLIKENVNRGHNYETAWGLWVAKSLKIKINSQLITSIFSSEDPVSILVALDLIHSKLVNKSVSKEIKMLKTNLVGSLYDGMWLLIYEATVKKWIDFTPTHFTDATFFKTLLNKGVSFYDSKNQVNFGIYAKSKKMLKDMTKSEKEKITESLGVEAFYRPGA